MDTQVLTIVFGLGVISHAFWTIRGRIKESYGRLLLCFGGAFLIPLIIYVEGGYGGIFHYYIFTYLLSFAFIFSLTFREEILPEISEKNILSMTIIFWFLLLIHGLPRILIPISFPVFIVLLMPTAGSLLLAFTKNKLGFYPKVFFYAWFLLAMVFTTCSYFSTGDVSFFTDTTASRTVNLLDVFLAGMVFMYLISITAPLMGLIAEKHHEEWMENARILARKYSNEQLKTATSIRIIVFQGGILALNYYLHLLPDSLLINIWIIFLPQLTKLNEPVKNTRTVR